MYKRCLFCFWTILLLSSFSLIKGQDFDMPVFLNISTNDGLSQNSIIRIYQDSKGYIWLCTRDGLNKYNGIEFMIYRSVPGDSLSLSNSDITSIVEDSTGDLWIGTYNGLNRMNPYTGKCEHFYSSLDDTTISDNCIKHLYKDSHDNIWIGTTKGLEMYNPGTNDFSRIYTHGAVTWIVEDSFGNLCFANDKDGFFTYNIVSGLITNYPLNSNDKIYTLFEDSNKRLWAGMWSSGLKLFNRKTGHFDSVDLRYVHDDSFNHEQIGYIIELGTGNLLLASRGGLIVFDPEKQQCITHWNQKQQNLINNTVISLFKDKDQNIWVGHWTDGVDLYSPYHNQFKVHEDFGGLLRGKIGSVHSFLELDGNLWIGTDVGLIAYNRKENKYSLYPVEQEEVRYLYAENEHTIWVSTYKKGIYLFDTRLRRYTGKMPVKSNVHIHSISRDEEGNYWMGSFTNGRLLRYKPASGKVEDRFVQKGDSNLFSLINVQQVLADGDYIWAATRSDGLYRYNYITGMLDQYKFSAKDVSSISNNNVSTSFKDTQGRFWFGTFGGGLCRYLPESDSFERYNKENGLENEVVCGIAEDENGQIWVSTLKGISVLNLQSKKFRNYNNRNGYLLGEANRQAFIKTTDSAFFVGGSNRFLSFTTSSVLSNPLEPEVHIEEISILPLKERKFPNIISVTSNSVIELPYNKASFQIKFAALNYVYSNQNEYVYQLKGFDEDFCYPGHQNSATYTNIPPGKYTFIVKGANNDGVWNETPDEISIIIHPPLWKTWWAYVLYLLIFLSLLYIFVRHIKIEERLKNTIRIKQIEQQSIEENHQLRMRLFTNFSHELRTPLTLIISPVEDMLRRSDLSEEYVTTFNLIKRNCDRLLWLVNQLLDFRKIESGKMTLKVYNDDLKSFIQEIVVAFQELSRRKEIGLTFKYNADADRIWYDPVLLEKVFFNLLSNALKFTQKGDSILVNVEQLTALTVAERYQIEGDDDFVLITVYDNGVAIAPEDLKNIFDPFYQSNNHETPVYGSGIGLNLCKSIVELHKGVIWAGSDGIKGSTFYVLLRCGNAHFSPADMGTECLGTEHIWMKELKVDEAEFQESETSVSVNDKQKPTILVIEDNTDLRHYISSLLKQNYNVIEESNGTDGLQKAVEDIPDLILSDIMMPGINGLELCRHIKQTMATSHIPVILITAKAAICQVKEGFEIGANDYILKPFDAELLLTRVRNILAYTDTLRQRFSKQFILSTGELDTKGDNDQFIENLMAYVRENISNPDLSVEELSKKMNISRVQLYRKVKAMTDMSPMKLLNDLRLKIAAEYLRNGSTNVSEVCYKVGFNDLSHFGKCFKSMYGVAPKAYIQQYGKNVKIDD